MEPKQTQPKQPKYFYHYYTISLSLSKQQPKQTQIKLSGKATTKYCYQLKKIPGMVIQGYLDRKILLSE